MQVLADLSAVPFVALHGAVGALDEIIMLALGIGLVFAVFKLARHKQPRDRGDQEKNS